MANTETRFRNFMSVLLDQDHVHTRDLVKLEDTLVNLLSDASLGRAFRYAVAQAVRDRETDTRNKLRALETRGE